MRVKTGATRRAKHKAILKLTKGFRMTKNRLIKVAIEAALHAGAYSYVGRKQRKRQFRTLWIQRINAGLKSVEGAPNYSKFIKALSTHKVEIDRKRRGGVIRIRFGSEDELIRLVDGLMGRRR